jgi:hypothetical protein
MNYYDRTNVVHLDGSSIFHKPEDQRAEREVADQISAAWKCKLYSFGALAPIDWYALRHDRMVGVLELKTRHHASDAFKVVFLNVRKWLALSLASVGLGVPAIFVVKFDDRVVWIPLSEIDPRPMRIAGCKRLVKSCNDIEPIIMIPFTSMRPLR